MRAVAAKPFKGSFLGRILAMAGILSVMPSWAQISWRTTHGQAEQGACELRSNSIRVKVTPAYLDVEEEAEIAAVGGLWGGGDPRTLEIHGQFSLTPGATVVSMLLWNGDVILKARLKGRAQANEEYEKVVDRDKQPPPRPLDPALIEYLGNHRYRIAIYPVESGKSRRIRIRYHLPVQMAQGGVMLRLATLFAPHIAARPERIEVRWERGAGEEDYQVWLSNRPQPLELPATLLIGAKESVFLTPVQPVKALVSMTSFPEGPYKGHYTGMYFQVPDRILNYPTLPGAAGYSVSAIIRSGDESYILDVPCSATGALACDPVIFHGKAEAPWHPQIAWKLYGSNGRELATETTEPVIFSPEGDSSLVSLWAGSALPFAEVRERHLGIKYGFVDASVSLLALEEDLLPDHLVPLYADRGVPRLTQADIVPPDTNDVFIPLPLDPTRPGDPNIGVPLTVRKAAGSASAPGAVARMDGRGKGLLSLDLARLPGFGAGVVKVTLYGMDGKAVLTQDIHVSADGGPALVSLGSLKEGFYFVKVEGAGFRWSGKVLLRR